MCAPELDNFGDFRVGLRRAGSAKKLQAVKSTSERETTSYKSFWVKIG